MASRRESDLLGERDLPGDPLWGIHTLRAAENFPVGPRVPMSLVRALAEVKQACALANLELGHLTKTRGEAVAAAAAEVAAGMWEDAFPLPALQGGAGTSTNMNVNEVIANRACELMGGPRGDRGLVDPLDHVNLHQSTNDTYPTALKIAAIRGFRGLAAAAAGLQGALQRKEAEFSRVVKIGRTEMVEAVPMTMGAEFSAFAEAVARDRWRTFKCEERLRSVNLGGTAVGTGLAAPRSYIFLAVEKLREVTGLPLARAENLVAETAGADAFVEVAGMLSAHAATRLKLSGDLRLLALLGEIRLPALQAGSSIMPGKVNPVVPEFAAQAALKAQADVGLVAAAVGAAHLQISELLPLVGGALLEALDLLTGADERLARHIDGILADPERCLEHLARSPGMITAFVPELGYAAATALARDFARSGQRDCRAFLEARLGAEAVARTLSPERLMALGAPDPAGRAS